MIKDVDRSLGLDSPAKTNEREMMRLHFRLRQTEML